MLVAMKVHPSPSKQGKYPYSKVPLLPYERNSRLLYGSGGLNLATLVDSRIPMTFVGKIASDTTVCEPVQDSQQQQAKHHGYGRWNTTTTAA
jgi:hypothetical protein